MRLVGFSIGNVHHRVAVTAEKGVFSPTVSLGFTYNTGEMTNA
jgi:hypothetical protein